MEWGTIKGVTLRHVISKLDERETGVFFEITRMIPNNDNKAYLNCKINSITN